MKKELVFIENASEITAGTRGASLGIGAMRVAANKIKNRFFRENPVKQIQNCNHLLLEDVKYPNAIRIGGLSQVFDFIGEEVKSTLEAGKFPFILAADHGSAGGTIAGIKAAFPNKRLGVVWVDAHADLHSPFTTPSGNMHGMPLATAIGENNEECAVNSPSEEVINMWDELKGKYGIQPKLLPEDLVFIGVRDTEKPEDELMSKHNIKNYKVDEFREKGMVKVVKEIEEKLSACDLIYISFDVDSMDDSISKGTGTPVPNGLWAEEAKSLLQSLISLEKTICFEMVEINPTLDDKGNVMAETAFDILDALVKTYKENKVLA